MVDIDERGWFPSWNVDDRLNEVSCWNGTAVRQWSASLPLLIPLFKIVFYVCFWWRELSMHRSNEVSVNRELALRFGNWVGIISPLFFLYLRCILCMFLVRMSMPRFERGVRARELALGLASTSLP
ncbi:hypothetical protein HNY73_009684 [Argiope bruennichi]|uniref:Uncharacterized protein n=1 Tax=Argiope bruennichi TaxID=94029 RepID=A0A8T0FB82_ARGBR|nr:hypothetical protein HNY73_009684 [Argiope bruennichi]